MASAIALMSPYNFLLHNIAVIFLVFTTDLNFAEGVGKWLVLLGGICCRLPLDAPQVHLYVAHGSLRGHLSGCDS